MQCLTHVVSMSPFHLRETVPAVPCLLVNARFPVCTSLTPRPMTVVFGMGTRQRVRMRTRLENGVLRNEQ